MRWRFRLSGPSCRQGSPTRSTTAAGGAAVQAFVARAVADHDRAAVRARGRVGRDGEGDFWAASELDTSTVQWLDRKVGRGVAVRKRVAVGEDGEVGAANYGCGRRLRNHC